jgi:SPP1 gp7 family putative phage head morphogenesis protein
MVSLIKGFKGLLRGLAFAESEARGIDLSHSFNLAPEKAVAYFRSKGNELSFDWHEVWQEAHTQAFTVAKVTRMDILQDIRSALDKDLSQGGTLATFKRQLEPTLKAKGWWGKQKVVDPKTGEEREAMLGSPRRLKTIYETNMRTAYSAGRWQEQLSRADDMPYLQYKSRRVGPFRRPEHVALHDKVFRIDDPFWATMYPPNDWGCKCWVRQLSAADLKEKGLKVESSAGKLDKEMALVSETTGELAEVSTYTDKATGEKTKTGAGWSHNPGLAAATDLSAYDKLKTWDKDLQTQFWADMQSREITKRREARLATFVDRIMGAKGKLRGESVVVGWVAESDVAAMASRGVALESPVMVLNDRGVTHMTRAEKPVQAALNVDEIKGLPTMLANPEAVLWDTQDPGLLYIVTLGEKKAKAVVRVNYRLKGQDERVNLVSTTGKVEAYNLRESRYQVLRGVVND